MTSVPRRTGIGATHPVRFERMPSALAVLPTLRHTSGESLPLRPVTIAISTASDPLTTLRQYAALAPWSLRDVSALAGAILEAS
jgi:hypothetical protein